MWLKQHKLICYLGGRRGGVGNDDQTQIHFHKSLTVICKGVDEHLHLCFSACSNEEQN